MFLIISGISSSGKNTVMRSLVNIRKNLKILERSSVTTRVPREGDARFNTYIYKDQEAFLKMVDEGKFVEHEEVHGNYYGVLKEPLDSVVEDKENDYIRDIDVKGNLSIRKYLSGKCRVVSIFLDAPDEVLMSRLRERGDSEEQIKIRLSRKDFERAHKKYYDLVIENIDLNKTLKIINDYMDEIKAKDSK